LENKDKLTKLATKLLEQEVIFREDLEDIFGKRPFDKDQDGNFTAGEMSKAFKEDKQHQADQAIIADALAKSELPSEVVESQEKKEDNLS
jgi:cell division protease FtsH